MADEKPVVGCTKHGKLTIDQIAELQPGLGSLMRDVSDRYWIAYYAAQGGNWSLAGYQLRGIRSLFKKGAMTRPKHKNMLETYIQRILNPLEQHAAARDFPAFDKTYREGVALANEMHVATKHGEIVWKLPTTPPLHLELNAPQM